MATYKVVLDTRRQLKDGTYPLTVRVYNGRKFRSINLKTYVKESDFDEKAQKVKRKHPNEKLINQRITQAVLQVQEVKLNLEMRDEVISADKIKKTVVKPRSKVDFLQYGENTVAELRKANRNGNADAYRDAINALKSYSGRNELQFIEMDYEFLCNLETKMLMEGLKKNSIAAYNRSLRAIYNKAIKDDLVEVKHYPYRHYKIKGEATVKRNITINDMKAIARMELAVNSPEWHARNYFILSFNLRGISFADMVTVSHKDINNGRLIYQRKKTHKLYSIKLTDKAIEILGYYKQLDRQYILPVIPSSAVGNQIEERKYIQYGTKTTNKYLRRIAFKLEIGHEVSTYYSRHSWATIAKKLGYSKDLISEALGHSYGNRITEIYLDSFDQDVIDEMNEKVSGLFERK